MIGRLRVECEEAMLVRDTEMFGKMDPWCQLETQNCKVRTRSLEGAGKTPRWAQTVYVDIYNQDEEILLSVWDEDNRFHDKVSTQ